MSSNNRTRARRRWRIAALAILLLGAGSFAGLPWVLNWPVARRLLRARANAILAPGSVEFAALHLSWFGPTQLVDVALRDERGDRLLVASRGSFSWSLWQILFARPGTATLRFPGGALDIERLPDGTIDLYQTLKPVIVERPHRRVIIRIERGRLRYRDPAFPEPVVADEADIVLDLSIADQPIAFQIGLARTAAEGEPGRLEIEGSSPRASAGRSDRGDATISLKAARWPWTLAAAGIEARGFLDGAIDARRRSARWRIAGEATVADLSATSGRLPAGSIRLESIRAAWTVEGGADLWTSQRLELSTPLSLAVGAESPPAAERSGGRPEGEVQLALEVRYTPPTGRLEIGSLALSSPYARLEGSGTIDGLIDGPRVELAGSLAPDWPALQSMLERRVEAGARIAGRPHDWRLAGPIATGAGADSLEGLRGELGIQLDALDVFGMRLSETAVVLRTEGGRVTVAPIDATLNQGRLHLEPRWVRAGQGRSRLQLDSASTLSDAVVNDEVSHRVLAYIAPILDGATRVQGRVSVKRLDADFPLSAADAVPARVEGDVLFDDVRFLPGPLAEAVIGLLPQPERTPMLALRDPISFRVAGGKVEQHGLMIPVGPVATVGLEGSVGFDKQLDLVARIAPNPPGTHRPALASILRTARIEVPIRGTFEHPKVDGQAMKERLKEMGLDVAETSVAAGVNGLLRLLEGLPARREARKPPAPEPGAGDRPERPGPPTAEERRHLREERRRDRLEKKADRRLKRGQPPG